MERISVRNFWPRVLVAVALKHSCKRVVSTRVLKVADHNFALTLVSLLLLAGCGSKSDRLPIRGTVSLNGAPLDHGSIRFTSVGIEKISATGAMIQDGDFDIPAEKGLPPGQYHLEITAPDNAAPPVRVRGPRGEPGVPTQPERIPSEYNVNSNKTIEVTEEGDNYFEFTIVNQLAK